jgi:hypothetical protein
MRPRAPSSRQRTCRWGRGEGTASRRRGHPRAHPHAHKSRLVPQPRRQLQERVHALPQGGAVVGGPRHRVQEHAQRVEAVPLLRRRQLERHVGCILVVPPPPQRVARGAPRRVLRAPPRRRVHKPGRARVCCVSARWKGGGEAVCVGKTCISCGSWEHRPRSGETCSTTEPQPSDMLKARRPRDTLTRVGTCTRPGGGGAVAARASASSGDPNGTHSRALMKHRGETAVTS